MRPVTYKTLPSWLPIGGITIGHTIYLKRDTPSGRAHEERHVEQQEAVGWFKFYLLYLLCAPILWNPWRVRWEAEAYRAGIAKGASRAAAVRHLSSWLYGWTCSRSRAEELLSEP